MEAVLRLLWRAGLLLKLKKWFLLEDSRDLLGHAIQPGRLRKSMKVTEAICELQEPTNVTELKSFLGLFIIF